VVGVVLKRVLTTQEVALVRTMLAEQLFVDGRATSEVEGKHNLQLPDDDDVARRAGELVATRLAAHEYFQQSVYPAAIISPTFSRYEPGMVYPRHVDRALIAGHRADVSVTVFLSDPGDYEGGDLEIETGNGDRSYRLPAGDAVAYPSTSSHRVTRVTRGLREAAVFWVQSMVRDAGRRSILAELDRVVRDLPPGPYADRVRRSHANLERMWVEP
jgi:PKHD-type hydroxylase